jgi:hypothetical protein
MEPIEIALRREHTLRTPNPLAIPFGEESFLKERLKRS